MDKQDKRLTQPERAFWRDAFLAVTSQLFAEPRSNDYAATVAADFADRAVQEYRTRILWRDRK
jgi:hypothetical protein